LQQGAPAFRAAILEDLRYYWLREALKPQALGFANPLTRAHLTAASKSSPGKPFLLAWYLQGWVQQQ
jgi:hypothetical protein